jgi:predicted nucleotidyltransferase
VVRKSTNQFDIISLYRTNYQARFYVRAMAKLLGISHVTLIPHLKKLEDDRILKSRKTGKNKEYFLNFENTIVKKHIMIAETLETARFLNEHFLIKKIYEAISPLGGCSLILFGSWAKSYATEESDVDIFCLGKTSDDKLEHIRKAGEVYGKKINVKTASVRNFVDGLEEGNALMKEVVEGHIILENPDLFVDLLWGSYVE